MGRDALTEFLAARGEVTHAADPVGRRLSGPQPEALDRAAAKLAAAPATPSHRLPVAPLPTLMTAEQTHVHTRLLNPGLLIDESRAYWRHHLDTPEADLVSRAFSESRAVKLSAPSARSRYQAGTPPGPKIPAIATGAHDGTWAPTTRKCGPSVGSGSGMRQHSFALKIGLYSTDADLRPRSDLDPRLFLLPRTGLRSARSIPLLVIGTFGSRK